MKTLILMRHAKSSWSTPGLDDHERPLNGRGKAAAPVMAEWLAAQGLRPGVILCSSSRRTRQTVKRMRKANPALPEPRIEPALYEAGPETIARTLAGLPGDCAAAMVVGHEPGLGEFLGELTGAAIAHFPTAAIAVIELDGGAWSDMSSGLSGSRARLVEFAVPREIMRSFKPSS